MNDIITQNSSRLMASALLYKENTMKSGLLVTQNSPGQHPKMYEKPVQKPLCKPRIKNLNQLNAMIHELDEKRSNYANNVTSEMRVNNFVRKIEKIFRYKKDLEFNNRLYFLSYDKNNLDFYTIMNCFVTNSAAMKLVRYKDLHTYFKSVPIENKVAVIEKLKAAVADRSIVDRVNRELLAKFPFSHFQKRIKTELLNNFCYQFYRKAIKLELSAIIESLFAHQYFYVSIEYLVEYTRAKLLNQDIRTLSGFEDRIKYTLVFFDEITKTLEKVS